MEYFAKFKVDTNTFCEVHNRNLISEEVIIEYGLLNEFYDEKRHNYFEEKEKRFPYSKFKVNGGCGVSSNFLHKINYCPQCRKEHIKWCNKNNSTMGMGIPKEKYDEFISESRKDLGLVESIPQSVYHFIETKHILKAVMELKKHYPELDISQAKYNCFVAKQKLESNLKW